MDTLLNRYRNITVLLLVILAQLVLLAYQVKNNSDVRLIRFCAVTAVTPLARTIEGLRGGTDGFLQNYVLLRDTRSENQRMRSELGRLKLENQFLKTELATADRVKALEAFETRTPSKMIAARVIGTATGASASAVFVDRGSAAGVEKGMAVVTPDGIVGKVLAAYPYASQVLLATDPTFAAGVVSQKNHVRGILKGLGHGNCRVDYLQNEEKVDTGEWFYTSGDDRIFPKGLPAGQVISARPGNPFQDVTVDPSGLAGGLEEVLIVLQGVHQDIPELKTAAAPVYLAPPLKEGQTEPSPSTSQPAASRPPLLTTDADKVREHYQQVGAAQGHKFGENLPGSKPADFNYQVKPGESVPVTAKPGLEGEKRIVGDEATAGPELPASPRPRPPGEQKAPVSRPKTVAPNKPAAPPQ